MRRNTITLAFFLLFTSTNLPAAEPVTLKNAVDPGPNKLDEPRIKAFSLDKALHFVDSAALHWQKKRKCFSCHTNYSYLYARPLVNVDAPAHREVRLFAEQLVTKRWKEKGPRWDAEVVATAAALAFNDRVTTGKLHSVTRTALDRIWKVQREDGGFNWLKCNWPPMESDDDYGACLAAIAVAVAPGDYAKTPAAKKGMAGILRFFKKNPPPMLHHRAMLLWAANINRSLRDRKSNVDRSLRDRKSNVDRSLRDRKIASRSDAATFRDWKIASPSDAFTLMSKKQQKDCIRDLFALQKKDGGWNVASMGNWKRTDKKQQDTISSDGYATGFAIYVLRQAGIPAKDERLQRGIAWLKRNQRESGRWITRSLNRDNKHYLSHAGTAFALMALAECGEINKRE